MAISRYHGRGTDHENTRMNRCPHCAIGLQQSVHGAITIDQCPRCLGTLLDAGEAEAVIGAGTEARDWVSSQDVRALGATELDCPRGHGTMDGYLVGTHGRHAVEVDVCPSCQSLWLDVQEGIRLRLATENMKRGLKPIGHKHGPLLFLFQLLSGLPTEVWNPLRRRALVVPILMVILTISFALEIALFSAEQLEGFVYLFGLVPARVLQGQGWWGAFTGMFLHGGIVHLLGNLYFLRLFGDNVEDRLGRRRFIVLYVLSGLAGAVLHVATHPSSNLPAIGASGAIAGLMGAYFVLFPHVKLWMVLFFVRFKLSALWYLLLWIGLQFFTGFFELAHLVITQVAVFDHIGGFAAGALIALYYRRALDQRLVPDLKR